MGIAKGRNISKAFLLLNICVYLLSRKKNIGEGNNSQSFLSLLERKGYLGRKETLMILIPGAVCCCEEHIKISSNFWPWVSIYRLESDIVQISLRSTSQITNYIYHIFLRESSYSIQWVSTVPDHSYGMQIESTNGWENDSSLYSGLHLNSCLQVCHLHM